MASKHDRELEQYRLLMLPPEQFAEGFGWKTVVGAFFLGVVMMPGSMYLSLFAGQGIGPAAQWVTIILFAEIARRSLTDLRMQEVYILYYMSGVAMAAPFSGLLWNQFYVQSDYAQAMGIASGIPSWWAPSAEQIREAGPTFFHRIWIVPILLVSFSVVTSQIDQFGLGYVLYRLTSDVEKLPFPMAPVGASGITALVEEKGATQRWRWRCFSLGGMLGIVFGAVYVGLPAVTGAILAKPVTLIPIPWVDLTPALTRFLPATPLNITFDLGALILGMVLPFWAVMGSLAGLLINFTANPLLHKYGILSNWTPQMGLVDTLYTNNVDFYLSFGAGLTFAVAFVGIMQIFRPLLGSLSPRARDRRSRADAADGTPGIWRRLVTNNVQRGDFSIFIALGIYLANSALWIGISCWLVPGFPWKFFVFYALVLTPLLSYATAKLEGLVGRSLQIPYVREATYILSGYRGVRIWFAPAPLPNYGQGTVNFRILELTGTRIPSQIKTLLVTVPIVLVSSLVFSNLLWKMAPIPSDAYPFAQKMWDLQAKNLSLTYSATLEGGSLFMEAWRWRYVGLGFSLGSVVYFLLSLLGLPTLLVFGVVHGLGQGTPGAILFLVTGALLGRFHFRKRFGEMWLKYTPVMLAGYSCGMGLVAMVAVGFTILTKMVSPLLY
jgi:hypothetical protein